MKPKTTDAASSPQLTFSILVDRLLTSLHRISLDLSFIFLPPGVGNAELSKFGVLGSWKAIARLLHGDSASDRDFISQLMK
jgi:hypothetical protein